MQQTRQPVALWLTNGIPERLVWDGKRYRVNDTPTRLEHPMAAHWHAAIAQPLLNYDAWRFQAIDDDGTALVFDVLQLEPGQWEVLRIYE